MHLVGEKWNIPTISINKDVTVITDFWPSKCEFLSPKGNQERKQYLRSGSHEAPKLSTFRL